AWLPSYLSIEVLFFVFSYLIFYYQYQLFLLGAADLSQSVYVSNSFAEGSNKAITLATVGMLAFAIGYRASPRATRAVGTDVEPASAMARPARTELKDVEQSGSGVGNTSRPLYFHAMATASSTVLLSLVALYLFAGWRSADEGRYTRTTTEAVGLEGTFVLILTFCMIVVALWIYARAAELRTPPMLVVGLVIAIAWSVRLLVLGDRSSFLLIALVLVGGYVTFLRWVPLVMLIVAFGLWLVVYRLIEVVRFIPNWYDSVNFWQLMSSSPTYQQSSSESSFNVTTIALRATVQVVPDIYDFTYGVFKLVQFSAIIPFSAKLYLPYLHSEYLRASDMLRDSMIGPLATWDPGTNVISDQYIDFGVLGVVVILFAFGLIAKAIRNYVAREPSEAHRVVVYLLALALFAEAPILNIGIPARMLAWALMFIALTGAFSRHSRHSHRPRR
ncbi:O-antigen polysaccharide polymerase Wzy, partial [Mycobacterium sp. URHB0044]|uniref:O-antigen polysaccharide polymerase Wzy n=1 Tax=Mycobacterium sp. URHB0044 TaxID=1380386 RepID=UPI0004902B76